MYPRWERQSARSKLYANLAASGSLIKGSSTSSSMMSSVAAARTKKARRLLSTRGERAGMSFLIVIAFFAIFGIIILTEVFMMDDRARNSNAAVIRHNNLASRFGESVPDYEDIKEDYGVQEKEILSKEQHLYARAHPRSGQQQHQRQQQQRRPNSPSTFHHKFNIGALSGRSSHEQSPAAESQLSINLPWGHILSASVEAQLPGYSRTLQVNGKASVGAWQPVNGTRFKFFVFSAYYDRRDGRMVRVIAATKTRRPERVWCRLWFSPGQPAVGGNQSSVESVTVMSRVKVIRENWNLKYSACFVLCPLNNLTAVPYAVSIVSRLKVAPRNLLLVMNSDSDPELEEIYAANATLSHANASLLAANNNQNSAAFAAMIPQRIGVCVKPFHFNYDQAFHLMEFLELNSLLGVTHFTFYNHTMGPRSSCLLDRYMNATYRNAVLHGNGVSRPAGDPVQPLSIDILPWDLKMRSQKEIRTEGLFAALNDCLYRSMYKYSHVLMIDLDEFIVPRQNRTLTDLIRWLTKRINGKTTGSFSFQNAFFYLQFPDDDDASALNEGRSDVARALLTQRKTQRRKKLHPQKQRSKYICRPDAVIEAGNHFVWEFVPGRGGTLNVNADVGILHHYRVCEYGGDDCVKAVSVHDRTAQKYGEELAARVDAMYRDLKTKCNLPSVVAAPVKVSHNSNSKRKSTKPNSDSKSSDKGTAAAAAVAIAEPRSSRSTRVQH